MTTEEIEAAIAEIERDTRDCLKHYLLFSMMMQEALEISKIIDLCRTGK